MNAPSNFDLIGSSHFIKTLKFLRNLKKQQQICSKHIMSAMQRKKHKRILKAAIAEYFEYLLVNL